MIVKYALTEEDYIQSNFDYIKFSDAFKKQLNMVKIGTCVILFIGSYVIIKGTTGLIVGAIIALLEFLLFEKYYKFTTGRKIKKAMTSEELSFYAKGVTLLTTPYGIHIEGRNKKLKYKWSDINMVGESNKRLYLFTDSGISEIIPKRDLDEAILKTELIDKIMEVGKATYKSI